MSILQVKNVPDELHAKLAARAKAEHTTMSAYVIALLERDLNVHPTTAWLAKVRSVNANNPPVSREAILRARDEARAEDDAHWGERLGLRDVPR